MDLQEIESKMIDLTKSNQTLQSQVEMLQLQVASYKSDFEDERKDREAAHSKMAGMEKKITQLEGRSGYEKAVLKYEMGELESDRATILEKLQKRDEELKTATKQLERHKEILRDLELVHQNHIRDASKEIEQLKRQASQTKSKQQAKASQVSQNTKENEKLKLKVASYKSDVKDDGKDYQVAQSEVVKTQKKIVAQLGSRNGQEKTLLTSEMCELESDKATILGQLQKSNEELEVTTEELRRQKEMNKEIEQLQIQAKSELQAKASALELYTTENEALKVKCDELNCQVQELKEESAANQQEILKYKDVHTQLQMELEQTHVQNQQLEHQLRHQIREVQELQRKLKTTKEEENVGFTQLHNMKSNTASWNFPRNDVKLGEEIGRGASGLVSKGQFHGQTVAIKQIHPFILTQKHIMEEFKREVKIMAGVQHPNLVRFVGAVFDEGVENFTATPLLLLELLQTNLRQGYERFNISLGVSVSIFRDVAYGLHYLHEHQQPIIHRDVSAPNVLLESLPGGMWRAKLSDFGSANFLKRSSTLGVGAVIYTAPEMFPREDPTAPAPRPTTKCDVFSYGIVLVEVITKTMPSLENRHQLFAQVQSKWRMMYDLIIQCTQQNSQNRPSMSTVLNTLNLIPVAKPR